MAIFIFHGTAGDPNENWLPWLKKSLEATGQTVIVPNFPTPTDQSLANWLKVMVPYQAEITDHTIFIGHSLGATFALTLLEKYSIQASFLVAGFIDLLGNPQFDQLNHSFVTHSFQWEKIKTNCSHFELFQSDNDPYVARTYAERLSQELQAPLTIIPKAGHFNLAAGYQTFPLLLERIQLQLHKF